ncbi:MAG: hypothetical protein CTY12_06575 [Methylotenera sp.]|nr:MAG: hypothetical protein CTY12_06575 [Methylotenera sp.]
MKSLTTNQHHDFKLAYPLFNSLCHQITAKAYQLELSPLLHCFILVTQSHQSEPEFVYDMMLIEAEQQQLFRFELCIEADVFEQTLVNTLQQEVSAEVYYAFISQHGFAVLDDGTLSLNKKLTMQGLDNILLNVQRLLNPLAIDTLHKIHLNIIPRLYNWLCEASMDRSMHRHQALLDYPVLLAPILAPTKVVTIPTLLTPENLQIDESERSVIITKAIDQGKALDTTLSEIFGLSTKTLQKIKRKSYWHLNEDSQSRLYQTLKNEIEIYATMRSS